MYMQQWFKDYSRSSNLTDDNGRRTFALVNKATRQAIVNRKDTSMQSDLQYRRGDVIKQVELAPYNYDDRVDISMLWTELAENGNDDGFNIIAVLSDNSLMLCWQHDGNNVSTGQGMVTVNYFSGQGNRHWKIVPVGRNAW
ncbi:hydroxyproline-rich glycoprotein family protein [Zea mays]|uniref:Hydroxyproline-rich glycoprotein family protein n=1 Tax=Zea mays TaxID=4577 RepID=K7TN76_MAIZE|nr:hydroxyproline-rich glycoprotein family protein [Zea mays]